MDTAPSSQQISAQPTRRLKKGELLFKEGDTSRSMYLLKSGSIRLFMKRGNSDIEIDTIRSGQILGELAFLDGNPRSVSGEALMDCELVEISGPMFMEVLGKAPEWLKIMLKTVVGRLRATNTRLRQLEAANVALDYSDKDGGKRTVTYQYLSLIDFMKITTALVLVGSRNGTQTPEGVDISIGLVNRYSNQIMGVPLAKTDCALDVLTASGLAASRDVGGNPRAYLKDVRFLEFLIEFLAEQNQLEPAKRQDVSSRGFLIMGLIVKALPNCKKDEKTGLVTVDVGQVKVAANTAAGKELFRNDDLSELVKLGYISELKIKSENEVLTNFKPEQFHNSFRFMQVLNSMKVVNEQKKQVSKGK